MFIDTEKGTITALCGRPAVGNSIIALNILESLCKQGKKCVYFSILPKETLVGKLLLQVANVKIGENTDNDNLEKITQAIKEIASWKLLLKNLSTSCLKTLEEVITENMPDCVFVDLTYTGDNNRLNLQNLKKLATSTNTKIVVMLYIHFKNKNTQYPALADIKEGKHLKKYADEIILLYREDYYNCDIPEERRHVFDVIHAQPENRSVKVKYNPMTGKILIYE